jgi:RNA polymerase subunit RPABC4/transcription elongation factor Spt4
MDDWGSLIRIVAAVAGAYWAILWLSAIVWTYRDAKDRSTDTTSQVVAVFLVVVFNIPGLFLYLILRPPLTMADAYERNLETEAILHEVGEMRACPSCKGRVEPEFLFCPHCAASLREPCHACGKPLSLTWQACPYCGKRRATRGAALNPPPELASSRETSPRLSVTPPP